MPDLLQNVSAVDLNRIEEILRDIFDEVAQNVDVERLAAGDGGDDQRPVGVVHSERSHQFESGNHVRHARIHHQEREHEEQKVRTRHLEAREKVRADDGECNRKNRGNHRDKRRVEDFSSDEVPRIGVVLPVERQRRQPRILKELGVVLQRDVEHQIERDERKEQNNDDKEVLCAFTP